MAIAAIAKAGDSIVSTYVQAMVSLKPMLKVYAYVPDRICMAAYVLLASIF